MRSFSTFFVIFLMCNSCLGNATENVDLINENIASPELEFQLKNQTGIVDHKQKMKFIELNIDVQLLIFDELNFDDLISMATINSMLHSVASRTFYGKYRDHTVWIGEGAFKTRRNGRKKFRMWNGPKTIFIRIEDNELALDCLQYFGSTIQKLYFDNVLVYFDNQIYTQEYSDEVARYDVMKDAVNKYTANSLTLLHLSGIAEDDLRQFTPFEKVEELSIYIRNEKPENQFKLNTFVPNVRRLEIRMNDYYNYEWLDCKFSHLEHLTVDFVTPSTPKGSKQIEAMLRKNSQIRSIEIDHFPPNYAEVINDLLPYIENLTITSGELTTNSEMIHFEYVKELKLRLYRPQSINKLTFERLESFHMEYSSSYTNFGIEYIVPEWLEFFQNHPNLSKLFLYSMKIPEIHLIEIINHFPNLMEIMIQIGNYIDPEIIVGIIESHKNLMKFVWRPDKYEESDMTMLRKRFEKEWNVRDVKKQLFWIERKN